MTIKPQRAVARLKVRLRAHRRKVKRANRTDLDAALPKSFILLLEKILEELEELNQRGPAENIQLMDNSELRDLLKIADTKFFRMKGKGLFPTYRIDGKDYYIAKEIYQVLKRHKVT